MLTDGLIYNVIRSLRVLMKRTKRKYTRKSDAPQSNSSPLKGESSVILPPHIQEDIKKTLEFRANLGLPDDSKERWERVRRYWEA